MPKTSGDELFERYLREQGYEPGPHEPSLARHGINKRPDFLPSAGALRIACEVEQFTPGASQLERRSANQRTTSASATEVYGPIRRRVASAARQLKPLTVLELPLVVVLANPEGAMIGLSVEDVIAALYGNPAYTMALDPASGKAVGNGAFIADRDGKLTNDHPYVSAVAMLRCREHRADETLPDGTYLYLDVIETVSESAVALPQEWFAGANDSRWRLDRDGDFVRIRGPHRS